jgi:hypothetical protein
VRSTSINQRIEVSLVILTYNECDNIQLLENEALRNAMNQRCRAIALEVFYRRRRELRRILSSGGQVFGSAVAVIVFLLSGTAGNAQKLSAEGAVIHATRYLRF